MFPGCCDTSLRGSGRKGLFCLTVEDAVHGARRTRWQEGEAAGHTVHTVRKQRDEIPFLFSPRDGISDGVFSLEMQHEYVQKCVS